MPQRAHNFRLARQIVFTVATDLDDHALRGQEIYAKHTHSSGFCCILAARAPCQDRKGQTVSGRLERYIHNFEHAAEVFLREHPDALVCGVAHDGQIVPVPQSIGMWGQGAIEGRAITDVVVAEDCMRAVDAWREVQKTGVAEAKVRLLGRPEHWATLHFLDLRANHGVILCILLPGAELAAQDLAMRAIAAVHDALPATPRSCTLIQDEGGIVLDIDEAFTQMFGYEAHEVIGKPILDQVHPDDQARTVESWIAMLSSHRIQQVRYRRRRKDGRCVWLEVTFHNYLNHPERKHVLVEMTDVSAEVAAQEALAEKSELLQRIVEGSQEGLLQVDRDRHVVFYNARLLEILHGAASRRLKSAGAGPCPSEPGRVRVGGLRDLLSPLSEESMESFQKALERALDRATDIDVEVDVALAAGGWRRVMMSIRALRGAAGQADGAIVSALEIEGAELVGDGLQRRASLDPLTRCVRHSATLAAVQRALAREESTLTGVIYIDLDDLRSVNETLGQAAGDELLVLVAERLRAASRAEDLVGRLGGDEFLVVLPEIATEEVAESIARRIDVALHSKAELSCGVISLSARIGVACAPAGSTLAKDLVKRAHRMLGYFGEREAAGQDPQRRSHEAHWRSARPRRLFWRRQLRRGAASGKTTIAPRAALAHSELEQRLTQHTRQHDAVAQLGQLALRERDHGVLLDEVCAVVARTLQVELSTVLRLRENEQALDMIAGVGFNHGPTTLPAGKKTQAGFALSTRSAVMTEDLRRESRFDASMLLAQGMRSGMSVVIEGRERPFGVLTAHASHPRIFSRDDVNFLVAIANVVSAALERERKEDSARHAALHDSLTGFPNRTLALDRIDRALARRRRDGTDVAVLLLDIDRFKIINDSLGHDAGDRALVALAARLDETLRPSDTIARLGGDEFLVISENDDGAHYSVDLAARLCDAIRRPLALDGEERHLSASVGIAVAGDSGDSAASLLRDADAAAHRAKEAGRGRYELFDADVRERVVSRLRIETELRRALQSDQLEVHYQPIIATASGLPAAVEALVRWRHPEHGLVPPLEFIPIAEETGLIGELGLRVLEQASAQCALWQRRYKTDLRIYVNVSGCQLANVEFAGQAVEIARRSRLLPGTLGLEVTESVLIDGKESSLNILAELDAHGLPLVLDDFGTGYSSLSYLRRFPLSAVKVDRSFIDGLGSNAQDTAIMRAIVQMCRALGLTLVGEGVETDAQLHELRKLGCDHVQGYLLCHPMPPSEATEYLDGRFAAGALSHAA